MGREDVSRTLLWNHLQSDISKNSQMIYHRTNPIRDRQWTNYIGDNPAPLLWQRSCVPSLDLYNACCFEIAAETVTSDIRWFTEKTIRPIAASTPFVLLATPGSLSTLQSMGFKTFRSLINEDYDQEEHLEKRIRMIISTVEDIVSNGSKQFAIAAESITQHNWNRLAEIKGRFNLEKDRKFFGLLGIC
jgi:hypothetical protein